MTSALHKRLQRLEELVAARVAPPIWRWQMDPNGDTAAELDRLVSSGEIAERDKGRRQIWRWLTREEALARGIEEPPPKPQPQLPAPPEVKLLPAPAAPQQPPKAPVDTQVTEPVFQAKRPLRSRCASCWQTESAPLASPSPIRRAIGHDATHRAGVLGQARWHSHSLGISG